LFNQQLIQKFSGILQKIRRLWLLFRQKIKKSTKIYGVNFWIEFLDNGFFTGSKKFSKLILAIELN
jgi:hypothetical protein